MTNPAARTHAQRSVDAEERLTQALAELIAEHGFERTTAAQIGERAGYSRAVVRDRYGTKEALLQAFHARYERMLIGPAEPAGEGPSGTGLDLIGAALERLVGFAHDHPVWLRALFSVSFESAGAGTSFVPVVSRWVDTLDAHAAEWLRAGQVDGSVDPSIDAAAEARRAIDEAIAGALRWTLGQSNEDYVAGLARWARQTVERLSRRDERGG